MGKHHADPWALRNAYITILLKRTPERVEAFLEEHFGDLDNTERTHVMRLLEMQRHELLMYTSCAWFFDEISGIETVQVMQYACRAIQLAESETDEKLEVEFMERIAKAKSNLAEYGDGAGVYDRFVRPSMLSLTQIGMQYAVSSLFAEDPDDITVFNYKCRSTEFRRIIQGSQRLALGQTHVRSKVTLSEKKFSFVALYLGQHHIVGKAFDEIPKEEWKEFSDKVTDAFQESNLGRVIEVFRMYPEQRSFSFFDMFKDEQIKMLNDILEESQSLAASSYRKINNRNYNVINVMRNSHLNPPRMLVRNLDMVLNNELRELFANGGTRISIPDLRRVVSEFKKWEFSIDHEELDFICAKKLNAMLEDFGIPEEANAGEFQRLLTNLREALELLSTVGIYPELNEIQDVVFHYLKNSVKEIDEGVREELLRFAEYINLEVDRFKKVSA
jgi:hypothetical protein